MRSCCTAFARFPLGLLSGCIEEVSVSTAVEAASQSRSKRKSVKPPLPDVWVVILALLAAIVVWYGARQLTPAVKQDDLSHPGPRMLNGQPIDPKSLRTHK